MLNCFRKTTCRHERISPNMLAGYCPDCGEYVKNQWYITRCKCCGVKQRTSIVRGKVSADTKFCRNCGSSSFEVEALGELSIVDINFAVVLKQVVHNEKRGFIQTWMEQNNYAQKMIPCY